MTLTTPATAGPSHGCGQISSSSRAAAGKTSAAGSGQQQAPSYLFIGSSAAFQQVKQTQASLARLSRVHNQNQQHQLQSQTNQSSQQLRESTNSQATTAIQQQQQNKSSTFVDCLIRRFKDCFSEDFCTVPMFVVGNLSPGSNGTHLILPPCVSLGRQNINRFASPKNMRLMNSIRESCRSIEELDLGGNKLNDLIEVYKILQCTPNLKFLNLSENDLSRSSPVAMAATCSFSSNNNVTSSSSSSAPHYASIPVGSPPSAHPPGWLPSGSSPGNPSSNRSCLAPINQNHQQQQAIGARRHSTLGQPLSQQQQHPATGLAPASSSSRLRQTNARLAETRRLAAAAALAQSKKTSSLVASKLANSATVHSRSLAHRPTVAAGLSRASPTGGAGAGCDLELAKVERKPSAGHQRHQGVATSTMHLARSLSSLSAKDVRAASSTMGRISAHGRLAGTRKTSASLRGSTTQSCSVQTRQDTTKSHSPAAPMSSARPSQSVDELPSPNGSGNGAGINSASAALAPQNKPKTSSGKLFTVEPIDESDDIDMGEQSAATGSGGTQETSQASQASHQQQQTRALAMQQTGTTTTATQMVRPNQGATSGPGSNSLQHQTGANSNSSSNNQSVNFRRTFESIKALALNNTGCQWRVVCSILNRMPNLEELHLSLNNYERIDLDPNEFRYPSLKRLYLCNNPKLTSWEELDKLLLAFPSLEALSIADCNISQIPDNLDRAREWQKLCGLNINGWPIKEWPVIERLNQLPSLIDLKCRNLEILNTIDEPRDHLIARLPKLQRLNGSEIQEREYAEKAFLRFFMANAHLERPSRFHELVQIHGEVIPVDVDVDLSPPSQAQVRVVYLNRNHYRKENEDDVLMSEEFLIKLMDNVEAEPGAIQSQQGLDCMEVGADDSSSENKPVRLFKDEGQEVVAIEVDLRQSVRKFKSTLASLFGLQSQNIILYYIDHEMVGLMGPEVIKHNQKKLWNYNVQDGDQFIVEER